MKKFISLALLVFSSITYMQADIKITLPEDCGIKTIDYYYAPINQFANAKTRTERGLVIDSVSVINSKAEINLPKLNDAMLLGLDIDSHDLSIYGYPKEEINLNILSFYPFDYELSGTELVSAMNDLHRKSFAVSSQFYNLSEEQQKDENLLQGILDQYNQVQADFIKNNPDNLAAPVALLNLEGEDFISTYEALENQMSNSIILPLAKKQYEIEKKNVEMEKKQQSLQSGEVEAPNFTLKNLNGKDVSLSDFRGKWVILDFWGSWCPWCIKGFPELKEAYEKYSEKLEIIGIDCKESEAAWKDGIEKYQLPWINVYNPEGTPLLSEYGVQGFPTKAIIDPEGKIKNITVGHNPDFFVILAKLLD